MAMRTPPLFAPHAAFSCKGIASSEVELADPDKHVWSTTSVVEDRLSPVHAGKAWLVVELPLAVLRLWALEDYYYRSQYGQQCGVWGSHSTSGQAARLVTRSRQGTTTGQALAQRCLKRLEVPL